MKNLETLFYICGLEHWCGRTHLAWIDFLQICVHKKNSMYFCCCTQMNDAERDRDDAVVSLTSRDLAGPSVTQQNDELRRRLDDEHAQYKRKLQSYHDEQQRQALLVQKLQTKVFCHSK